MTTTERRPTQMYGVYIKGARRDLGRDHQGGVHEPVFPRLAMSSRASSPALAYKRLVFGPDRSCSSTARFSSRTRRGA